MTPDPPEDEGQDRVLVVDDEPGARELLAEVLSISGFRCEAVGNAEEAVRQLRQGGIDLVFTDMQMPGQSGLDLIEEIRRIDDSIPVILITGYPSVNTAVDAMKRGAVDFLPSRSTSIW
jgi:DNA-binding NtrC family response regulator